MNEAHLHLILNHAPVVGSVFLIAVLAYALIRNQEPVKVFSLYFVMAVCALTVPAYYSGEAAEEIIEDNPEFAGPYLHDHEEAAEVALLATAALGTLTLVGFLRYGGKRNVPRVFLAVLLAGALVIAASLLYTANLGGLIRHTEIRTAAF